MKKKKIILFVAVGILVLAGIATPLIIGSHGNMGGGITGSVNEEWNKTVLHLGYDESYDYGCDSGNSGDYINPVVFRNGKISYGLRFSMFDDLEVYCVFDNGYTTDIETSHWMVGGDYIEIDEDDFEEYDLKNHFIVEVWVRTVD